MPEERRVKDPGRERFSRFSFVIVSSCLVLSAIYVFYFWKEKLFVSPQKYFDSVYYALEENYYDRERMPFLLKFWQDNRAAAVLSNASRSLKLSEQLVKETTDPLTRIHTTEEWVRLLLNKYNYGTSLGIVTSSRVKPLRIRAVQKDGPGDRAGLKAGDEILSIDELDCSRLPPAHVGIYLARHTDTKCKFVIRHDKQIATVYIKQEMLKHANTVCKQFPGGVGFLRISSFLADDLVKDVERDLQSLETNSQSLILDLRGNPGGRVDYAFAVASLFLDHGSLVSLSRRISKDTVRDCHYVLTEQSVETQVLENGSYRVVESEKRLNCIWHDKPIFILVDDSTASAAEILTAVLKQKQSTVVCGKQTYGKGLVQILYPLPNLTALSITTGKYLTPDGKWLGNGLCAPDAGLFPDITIDPSDKLEYLGPSDNQLTSCLSLARQHK